MCWILNRFIYAQGNKVTSDYCLHGQNYTPSRQLLCTSISSGTSSIVVWISVWSKSTTSDSLRVWSNLSSSFLPKASASWQWRGNIWLSLMTIKVRKHKGNICKGWSQGIFLTYNSHVGNKIFQWDPCEWSHKFKLGTNFGTCEQIFLVHMKRTVSCNHSLQPFPANIPLMSNDLYHM